MIKWLFLLAGAWSLLHAQQIVSGKVLDANGKAIGKVHVYSFRGDEETFTTDDGFFRIRVDKSDSIRLNFSHPKFTVLSLQVALPATQITVVLKPNSLP
jgi:hypothetical protein